MKVTKAKLAILAGTILCITSSALADYTVNGYTYNYEILYSSGLPSGVSIRPIFDTSSHNMKSAVSPRPTGDYVIPNYLPYDRTNFLPVVKIGYQPRPSRNYAGAGNAFSSTSMTKVTIPDTVRIVDCTAFANCTSLEHIVFPADLTTIGKYAFANCPRLTVIDLPAELETIDIGAFSGCASLERIALPEGLKRIGDSAFSSCSSFNSDEGYVTGNVASTNLASVTIPNSVTNVGGYAFSNCTGLRTATIGGGDIGYGAFRGCTALSDVTLGENVTSIGERAFHGCTNLTELVIHDAVTNIGDYAFEDCHNLTRVTLGEGLKNIGTHAFYGCSSLREIVIPADVQKIGSGAFACCDLLETVEVKSGDIGEGAFSSCTNLTCVTMGDGVRSIGNNAFMGCYCLTNLTLGNTVTSIGDSAFYYCIGLTSVTIPDSVIEMGSGAFYMCWSLEDVTIGKGLKEIRYATFEQCDLKSLTIPDNIKCIDVQAFMCCTKLTSVTIGNGVERIWYLAFAECDSLTNVTIESDVVDIDSSAFPLIEVDGFVLDGFGCLYNDYSGVLDLSVERPGIRGIGSYAFARPYCNCKMTGVIIPDSVNGVGDGAFKDCYEMKSVIIGKGVKRIGVGAFSGCGNLTNVVFMGNAPEIEGGDNGVFDSVSSDCVAYVSRHSTGWGVEVGEKWNGITLRYWPESLTAVTSDAEVDNVMAMFADEGIKSKITTVAGYNSFKAWVDAKNLYQPAVVANAHVAAAYLLGADRLFENEPTVEIGEVAVGDGTDGTGDRGTFTVSVMVNDGEMSAKVDAAKVAEMFEATSDLGDWNGATKIVPQVQVVDEGITPLMGTIVKGQSRAILPVRFPRCRAFSAH